MKLTPKDWDSFQHYKDRDPPWIKLHRGLLDNMEYAQLSADAAKLLPLFWLLCSEKPGGVIDYDAGRIAFRLRTDAGLVERCVKELLAARFLVDGTEAAPSATQKTKAESIGWGSRHIPDGIKREVFLRDGGKCRHCSSTLNIEYDHIIPVSKGGTSILENIQLLCRPCNRKKRTKTAEHLATPAQPVLGKRTPEAEREVEKKEPIGSSSADADSATGKTVTLLCPHERIRALYHEVLPELPKAKLWGDDRQKALRARWVEMSDEKGWQSQDEGVEWFRRFFEAVREDDWAMGRTPRGKGHENWECSIDYLLSVKGFRRIFETAGRKRAAT